MVDRVGDPWSGGSSAGAIHHSDRGSQYASTIFGRILAESRLGASELIETLKLEEITAAPRPCLTLRTPRQNWGPNSDRLLGELEFDYGGALLPAGRTTPLAVSTELNLVIRRDPAAEAAAAERQASGRQAAPAD